MKLTITIVSYNTRDLVRNSLNSLLAHPPSLEFKIIVVDNASADDTVGMVRREFPQVVLITNDSNVGYAAAVNQGLRHDEAGYALILNSDIEVHEGAIDTLLSFMQETAQAGMCAPQLILPDGQPQRTWGQGFTLGQFARQEFMLDRLVGQAPVRAASSREVSRLEAARTIPEAARTDALPTPRTAVEVEHLDGAALLVRREAITQVGLMDEGYWMYCEDSDWSLRFRRAGWKLYHVPAAQMLHHHGASSRECRAEMIAAYKRAAARYFRLHEGALEGWLARLMGLAGTGLRLFGAILGSILTLGLYKPLVRKAALFSRALDLQVRQR